MSCHTSHCHPSGLPQPNNECCTDVAEYTRFAYSSAQSAYANAQNAQQSAQDAAATLANVVLKSGDTMTGALILDADPVVALGAATKQYVDAEDALKVNRAGDTMTGHLNVLAGATGTQAPRASEVVSIFGDTMSGSLTVTGNIYSNSPTSLIGYNTGAGGTITQLTNKATAVTLDRPTGQITMNAAALNANTTVSFTLTNSTISAGDILILNHISGGTAGSYLLNAQSAAGSASINVRNITAGSLSEAIVIAFAVIKAVTL
jgi:hypothetical protein